MAQQTRIKFNPQSREVEIEGSETFVKKYFSIIQSMLTGTAVKTKQKVSVKKPGRTKASAKKVKSAKGPRKTSMTGKIIALVQASPNGINVNTIIKKTKASKSLVWNMLSKAKKEKKVAAISRGVYGPA